VRPLLSSAPNLFSKQVKNANRLITLVLWRQGSRLLRFLNLDQQLELPRTYPLLNKFMSLVLWHKKRMIRSRTRTRNHSLGRLHSCSNKKQLLILNLIQPKLLWVRACLTSLQAPTWETQRRYWLVSSSTSTSLTNMELLQVLEIRLMWKTILISLSIAFNIIQPSFQTIILITSSKIWTHCATSPSRYL